MKTALSIYLVVITAILGLTDCVPDPGDDAIPYIPFDDIVINLSLPEYAALKVNGGTKTIEGGVRGIILYRLNASTYIAYERNCSFTPTEACATVDIHVSTLYMFDPCCGSSFSFSDGNPIGGVAWRPLRKYRTSLDSEFLTVTDEIFD